MRLFIENGADVNSVDVAFNDTKLNLAIIGGIYGN